jgi:hypothetical protein
MGFVEIGGSDGMYMNLLSVAIGDLREMLSHIE